MKLAKGKELNDSYSDQISTERFHYLLNTNDSINSTFMEYI